MTAASSARNSAHNHLRLPLSRRGQSRRQRPLQLPLRRPPPLRQQHRPLLLLPLPVRNSAQNNVKNSARIVATNAGMTAATSGRISAQDNVMSGAARRLSSLRRRSRHPPHRRKPNRSSR